MSASLYWEPAARQRSKPLPDALKFALRKRYNGEAVLDRHDVPYLEGLRDADVEGAQDLIDLIEKHDAVRIWEES